MAGTDLQMGLTCRLVSVGCRHGVDVMNLLWIAAIALFVLLENVLPIGAQAGRWTTESSGLRRIALSSLRDDSRH